MIVHHFISKAELARLFAAVAKPAPMFTVIGAKNTLDRKSPDYSPAYISEQFATRAEADADAESCGYPLVEVEEDLDWIAPAWWHVLTVFATH